MAAMGQPWHHPEAARAALLSLLRTHSYAEREVVLSSGQKSSFYIDCKQTVLRGRGHTLVGVCLLAQLQRLEATQAHLPAHAAVGGLTMGADPLSSALSLWADLQGRELPAIYIRKEAKGHGTGAYLEGTSAVAAGARVVVVEDVVTTGAASKTAIERLRDHGHQVDTVLSIIDREAGGREALSSLGVTLHALFGVADLRASP
jgi:orotate phosphoribosyltransferase